MTHPEAVALSEHEVTDRLREPHHPADTFPYTTNTGRHKDSDHTIPTS